MKTPAQALIHLPSREIAGIRAEVAGKPCFIKARKASSSPAAALEFDFEMQKQFLPAGRFYCRVPSNTGDGIRMDSRSAPALAHE